MAICPHCKTRTDAAFQMCPTRDGYFTVPDEDYSAYSDEALLGRAVGGRFVVHQLLGRGSMARVFKARQLKIDRDVALKIFDAENLKHEVMPTGTEQDAVELAEHRFETEARVLAKLDHPNCVTLYDYGVADEGRFLYIAMENVQGMSLRTAINRGLKFNAISEITQQVLLALREAHALQIVHRDLKPENIILSLRFSTEEPVVKVVDFGIAKMLNPLEPDKTVAGTLFGTPAYMSPEQCRGDVKAVGAHSDIYAFGCILYEMITGELPFPGRTPQEMLRMHQEEELPEIRPRPGLAVSDGMKAFVRACTAKEPEARFPRGELALAAFKKVLDPAWDGDISTSDLMIDRALQAGSPRGARVVVPQNRIRGDSIAPPLVAAEPHVESQNSIQVEEFESEQTRMHPLPDAQSVSKGQNSPTSKTALLLLFLFVVLAFTVVAFYFIFAMIVGGS